MSQEFEPFVQHAFTKGQQASPALRNAVGTFLAKPTQASAQRAAILVPREIQAELVAWAREARPKEACGLLYRGSQCQHSVVRAVCVPNLAKGTKETHFIIDPAAWVQADRLARAGELSLLGFWHSHPLGQLWPSRADEEAAWEGSLHMIVLTGGDLGAYRLQAGRFAPVKILTDC